MLHCARLRNSLLTPRFVPCFAPCFAGSPTSLRRSQQAAAGAGRGDGAAAATPPVTPPVAGKKKVVHLAGSPASSNKTNVAAMLSVATGCSFDFVSYTHVTAKSLCVVVLGGNGQAARACDPLNEASRAMVVTNALRANPRVPVIDCSRLGEVLQRAGCHASSVAAVNHVLLRHCTKPSTPAGGASGAAAGGAAGGGAAGGGDDSRRMVHFFQLLRRTESGKALLKTGASGAHVVYGAQYKKILAKAEREYTSLSGKDAMKSDSGVFFEEAYASQVVDMMKVCLAHKCLELLPSA